MTWPSARRTMCGGSLKPDPSYSPISSMPSASRGAGEAAGTAVKGSVVTVVGAAIVLAQDAPGLALAWDELVRQHLERTGLLGLERIGELTGRQVLVLERAQLAADVGQGGRALAREAHRLVHDA